MLIYGEAHLRQVLSSYAQYYNELRTHLALGKDAPMSRVTQPSGAIVAIPILSGPHHSLCPDMFRKGQVTQRSYQKACGTKSRLCPACDWFSQGRDASRRCVVSSALDIASGFSAIGLSTAGAAFAAPTSAGASATTV